MTHVTKGFDQTPSHGTSGISVFLCERHSFGCAFSFGHYSEFLFVLGVSSADSFPNVKRKIRTGRGRVATGTSNCRKLQPRSRIQSMNRSPV
jgi:hypothetical protein